jgi:hypothetical protein
MTDISNPQIKMARKDIIGHEQSIEYLTAWGAPRRVIAVWERAIVRLRSFIVSEEKYLASSKIKREAKAAAPRRTVVRAAPGTHPKYAANHRRRVLRATAPAGLP